MAINVMLQKYVEYFKVCFFLWSAKSTDILLLIIFQQDGKIAVIAQKLSIAWFLLCYGYY